MKWHLAFVATLVVAAAGTAQAQGLKRIGPIDPVHGYPIWFQDSNDVVLDLCLDHTDLLCPPIDERPDPGAPVVFPDNFPGEAFWWLGESTMATGAGEALLVMALESTFAAEEVIDGDQIAFGRIRLRIDVPQAGTYTVIHPYGRDVFVVDTPGRRAINFTEDIGIGAPGDFTGVLKSRIGPFLRATNAPQGYMGNPNQLAPVTGSPHGTNYFRIEGDNIGGPGVHAIQTNLFSIAGREARRVGVGSDRATYTRTPAGATTADVFAFTLSGRQIVASGTGLPTTPLTGNAAGDYFAHVALPGAPPASVRVTNQSDVPPFPVDVPLVDHVTIQRAEYSTTAQTLTIVAASSDLFQPPTLTFGLLSLVDGTLVVPGVTVPPPFVTVSSTRGGQATVLITVVGESTAPLPVVANAGPDLRVQQGQTVTLNGGQSTGDITGWQWTQEGGTQVALSGAAGTVASFVAPNQATTLRFRLTVQGPGGPSSDTVDVVVDPVAQPVAIAAPVAAARRGSIVTLDGSGSQGASTWQWTRVSGAVVALQNANTAVATFEMPQTNLPITFRLTVTGPGGSASTQVTVSMARDQITVTEASFRQRTLEWRIAGTAALVGPGNTITVRNGSTLASPIIGTAEVDALGEWSVRLRPGPNLNGANRISVVSSLGAVLLNVPITRE